MLYFPSLLQAQQGSFTIEGTVTDAGTGTTLPAANIVIEGSYSGTITNPDGYYELTLADLPTTITVRYIGYHSESRVITEESDRKQNFSLEPATVEMDEIVVTDRDPALSIMERVIERKKIWRADLKNYRVEAYSRQVMENDTAIVSITESISEAFWDKDHGHREVIKSQDQTANLESSVNFTGVRYMPNFYDDDIEISGFEMVGPTHPDALDYYYFRLADRLQIDDQLVYKIEMEPKRKRQPTFHGTLYVLDREYALLEVQLTPNRVVRFPPPVRDFDLRYEQQFSNYGGDFWLPVDMRINGLIRIEMIGLRFPPIKFTQLSRLSDYQVNTELPDTLFEDRQILRRDTTTIADHSLLEQSPNRVPLTLEEQVAYDTIDSTATLEKAFQPSGFIARRLIDDDENSGRSGNRLEAISGIIPDGLGVGARFNRMDGYHLGLRYSKNIGRLSGRIESGYSTHSEKWDAGGRLELQWLNRTRLRSAVHARYQLKTDNRFDSRYSIGMNSISTLSGAEDYFDYFRNETIHTGLQFTQPNYSLRGGVQYRLEEHSNFRIEPYQYSLFGWHKERRLNPDIEEGKLRSLAFHLGWNEQSDDFGITGHRSVRLDLEASRPGLGSDFDFTRARIQAHWNKETFYQRRLFPNTLDLFLSAGYSSGVLPIQRRFAVDGSIAGFTPFGVLKTRRNLPYEGDRYWLIYAEHNFRTIPFEALGLESLADRGWSLILFGGAARSRFVTADAGQVAGAPDHLDGVPGRNGLDLLPMTTGGIHTEAGASLNSIFGILRLDAALRLDTSGFYIGFSVPRYF